MKKFLKNLLIGFIISLLGTLSFASIGIAVYEFIFKIPMCLGWLGIVYFFVDLFCIGLGVFGLRYLGYAFMSDKKEKK